MKTKTILIVDDDHAVQLLYIAFFEILGGATRTAFNGMIAIDLLKKEKIDLIIMDLAMPGGDGEVVLEEMAKNPEWQKIPIIIDSALGPVTGRQARIEERFKGKLRYKFFYRPTSLEQIKEAMHEMGL